MARWQAAWASPPRRDCGLRPTAAQHLQKYRPRWCLSQGPRSHTTLAKRSLCARGSRSPVALQVHLHGCGLIPSALFGHWEDRENGLSSLSHQPLWSSERSTGLSNVRHLDKDTLLLFSRGCCWCTSGCGLSLGSSHMEDGHEMCSSAAPQKGTQTSIMALTKLTSTPTSNGD